MDFSSGRLAVVAETETGTTAVKRLPIPAPGSDELLVKVAFVALNPADPAMIQFRLTPTGGVLGLDCAGEVVGVGSSVDGWKIGDRIAGVTPGGTGHRWGAATEYAIVDAALAWHVPDSIDLAAATTYGIAGATAALVLYHHLQVPEPPAQVPDAPWFLVAGGSSSVGLFLVQWAKLAGFRVVATASEHNFGLVKDYGAEEVLSYHEASHAIAAIRALQPPPAFGVDMIGGPCGDLVAEAVAEGKTLSINWQCHKDAELVRMGAAFAPKEDTALWNSSVPAIRDWAKEFFQSLPSLILRHEIRPGPITLRKGLHLIPEGIEELHKGVSATKLVYEVLHQ